MSVACNNPADLETDNAVGQTPPPGVRVQIDQEGSTAGEDTNWEELFGTDACADDHDAPESTTSVSDDLQSNKENVLHDHAAVETKKTPSSPQRSKAQAPPQPPAVQSKPLSHRNSATGISLEVPPPTTGSQVTFNLYQDERQTTASAPPVGAVFRPNVITFMPPTIVHTNQDEVAGAQAALVIQGPSRPSAAKKAARNEVGQQAPVPRAKAPKRKAAGDETTRRVKGKKKAENVQEDPVVFAAPSFQTTHDERPAPMPADEGCIKLYSPPIWHLRDQQLAPNEALYAEVEPVTNVSQLVFAHWHNTEREPLFPDELVLRDGIVGKKVQGDRLPILQCMASVPEPKKHVKKEILDQFFQDVVSDATFDPMPWSTMKTYRRDE
ncbi:hypothetical protein CPB85DRAFT_984643 [Mucidula mucida]|nr:hypothetical protein CPB85DRAFT_984643 [Mucidula mucida]